MVVKRIKNDELYHHGIKGQKWGVRRYQNADGSYTGEGLKRYKKTLNDLENKRGRLKYEITKSTRRSNLARYGPGPRQFDREFGGEKKAKEWDVKRKNAENQLKEIDAATKKTIDAAIKNNFHIDINYAAKTKNYAAGKQMTTQALFGIGPAALVVGNEYSNGSVQRLDKYNVSRRIAGQEDVTHIVKSRNLKASKQLSDYHNQKAQAGKVYADAIKEARKKKK